MAHRNTLRTLRISLTTAVALAGCSVASAADWQPRAAMAPSSIDIPAADGNWQPRKSMQISQTGLVTVTQAAGAPRSATKGRPPVVVAELDTNTAAWAPRAAIANPQVDKPGVIADWAPRASVESDVTIVRAIMRRHRGSAAIALVASDFVSTSAVPN